MLSGSTTITSPVGELHACLDRLVSVDPASLTDEEQAELVRELAGAEARVAALKLKVLAAAEKSQTARRAGAATTGQWAAKLSCDDGAEAQRQVALAGRLERRTATQQALATGQISTAKADIIVRADTQLPSTVTTDQRATVEAALLDKARIMSPSTLRRAARRAIEAVEPDPDVVDAHEERLVRDEEDAARGKSRLTLHDNADGTVTGHFIVPTLQGHLLRKILDTMTAPRRARLGASRAQAGDPQGPDTDWHHARGVAFCELLEHLPTDHLHPRTAATVVVTVDEEELRGRIAAAGLDSADKISAGAARRLACGAGIMPAVLGGRSEVLDLGRSKRLFSDQQRVAIGINHRTCAADGCERPFAWCELHHRQPWGRLGRTDLAEGIPLCSFHHRRIHDAGFLHRRLPDGSIRFSRRT
jgi:hypothetical protein